MRLCHCSGPGSVSKNGLGLLRPRITGGLVDETMSPRRFWRPAFPREGDGALVLWALGVGALAGEALRARFLETGAKAGAVALECEG